MASYPGAAKSFTVRNDGDDIEASHVDDLQDETAAIETGLLSGFQHLLKPLATATFDLGTTLAQWRDLYLSRNAMIGGTLNVTGATTVGDLRGTVETITATGTVTDQSLSATTTIVRFNNASALTVEGFTGGSDGRILVLESVGAGHVYLAHQNASAVTTNRLINCATSSNTPLAAGVGTALYQYDGTTARWRLLTHEQGSWITPTFAAGDYVASSGNWTLASGDVQTQRYWLRGRTLTVGFSLINTTVSATPANLFIGNGAYGGFVGSSGTAVIYAYLLYNDNAGGNAVGYMAVSASDTRITLAKISGTWSVATDATNAFGTMVFEVQ